MDTIISRRLASDRLYAYHRNRFWLWDDTRHSWKESHLMSQKFEREHDARPTLTPADFMTDLTKFQQLDEFEIDSAMLDALKDTKPCKAAPIKPVEELPPQSAQCSDAATAAEKQTAAFPAVPEVSSPTTEMAPAAQNAAVPASASEKSVARSAGSESSSDKTLNFLPENTIPEFDYSGLPEQTVDDLHFAEDEYRHGKKLAERGLVHMGNAIAAAHDALCGVVQQLDNSKHGNRGDDSFRAWCCSIGITKSTAYNLLQVSALMDGSSPRQRAILEALPPTLLYAVAKPSAPAELVEKVKNGEVSTNKEYQDLLVQIKAEKERADAAEAERDKLLGAQNRAAWAESHIQDVEAQRVAALADVQGLTEQNAQLKERADSAEAREEEAWKMQSKAEARAKNAENQLAGSRQVAEAAKLRGDKLKAENDALKSQPITAVVDEEEVDRRAAEKAWGLADARNRELQEENDRLKKNSAQLERRMKAMTSRMDDLGQTDFETANHCPEAMLAIWNSCKGSYSRLTGEDLENTFQYICNTLNSIRQEAALLCRQPEGYDGGAA